MPSGLPEVLSVGHPLPFAVLLRQLTAIWSLGDEQVVVGVIVGSAVPVLHDQDLHAAPSSHFKKQLKHFSVSSEIYLKHRSNNNPADI